MHSRHVLDHLPLRRLIRRVLVGSLVVVSVSPMVDVSVAQAASTTTTTPTTTPATTTSGTAGANVTPLAFSTGAVGGEMTAVSCTAPGYCVGGGTEIAAGARERAVLLTETSGVWGPAHAVATGAPLAGSSMAIEHVVCVKLGACVALGTTILSSGTSAGAHFSSFLVVQSGTRWGRAQNIPVTGLGTHPSYVLTGMACIAKGWCVITGTLLVNNNPVKVFSFTWRHGHWGYPVFLSGAALGPKAKLMSLAALSCVGAWCEGVGLYTSASTVAAAAGNNFGPYVVTYSGGHWHGARALHPYRATTDISLIQTISCTSVGNCVAGGQNDSLKGSATTAVAVEEHHGHWGTPYALGLVSAHVLETVSCVGVTACTGVIAATSASFAGVVSMSASHHWALRDSSSVPGWYSLQGFSMSCVDDACTIVGAGTSSASSGPRPVAITPSAA